MKDVLMHPTDADILRYLDSEMREGEPAELEDHIAACVPCRDVMEQFRLYSVEVEHLVGPDSELTTAVPVSRRRPRAPGLAIIPRHEQARSYTRASLRAAILILSLGIVAVAVAPVRAWVIQFLAGTDEATPPVSNQYSTEAVTQSAPSSSSIAFVPRSAAFEISITEWQAGGALTMVPVAGTRAQGSISGDDPDVSLFVAESGLGITNGPGSVASYHILIPSSVTVVTVRVDTTIVRRIDRSAMTDHVILPLRRTNQ